ncbi:hypothetical protein CAEBREN_12665 [Caenorhabditis brenneri]|uniref:BAAT/Acyl-CoA thioester hydrolase C-terminal domain-containing protein n=1 Tax=Caenorhabditis brenneri TaxID=135651 RepID=G0MA59_CAEBE|nr:hypothetical protein CAEBREN_12665 [Caenorhabditis brenneri]
MGLFLSLQLSDEVPFAHYTRNNKAAPFYYTLKLFTRSHELIDQVHLRKYWIHPNVTEIEVHKDGLYGIIYKPPGPGPFPCIIDVPGISAYIIKGCSAVFSSDGFLVYTFATFGYEGLPKRLPDVDIETYSRHIEFVKSLPYCSGKIGLFGNSFGGTIANYLATKHPEICAVVNCNAPEAFLRDNAVLKENGKPMKCERLEGKSGILVNTVLKQKQVFLDSFARLTPDTSVRWDKIPMGTPVRIVASLDDWLFCGVTNGYNMRSNLMTTGHKVEFELVPSGHGILVPYFPHVLFAFNPVIKLNLGFGGECILATKSQETVWQKHLAFFRKHLGTPPALPDFVREKKIILPRKDSKL